MGGGGGWVEGEEVSVGLGLWCVLMCVVCAFVCVHLRILYYFQVFRVSGYPPPSLLLFCLQKDR